MQIQTQLSPQANSLHEKALVLSREHRLVESQLVSLLMEIDRLQLYRLLGCASLFTYVVSMLGFSEGAAYQLITVARKAKDIVILRTALEEQRLTVAKASRIVSILSVDNASELIEFASRHSSRETDLEVARRAGRDGNERRSSLKIPVRVLAKLKHVQSLMDVVEFEAMLEKLADYYIEREDPVRKAQRALAKRAAAAAESGSASSERSELAESERSESMRAKSRARSRKSTPNKRKPITARELHTVNARDGRRCTFIDTKGNRCPNERWLHVHHIQNVSRGGTNNPANLITLCSRHHQLVHQSSTWIKAPTRSYQSWSFPRTHTYDAGRDALRSLSPLVAFVRPLDKPRPRSLE